MAKTGQFGTEMFSCPVYGNPKQEYQNRSQGFFARPGSRSDHTARVTRLVAPRGWS